MNVFQAFEARRKSNAIDSDHLPEVNAFVDVAAGGKTEHLPIENVGRSTFTVRRPVNAAVGARALFNYENPRGRFRFHADCTSLEARTAMYALPAQITIIEQFGDKRRNFRLSIALPVRWRYAPDGAGYGEFVVGNTLNISCTGIALVVPRELRKGTQIEVKLDVETAAPLVLVGTLMRATQKAAGSKFVAGLAFHDISPTKANTIGDFIANRQHRQRRRGLAD